MKVIIVSEELIQTEDVQGLYSSISEPQEILIFEPKTASERLINEVFSPQRHIDLIVCQDPKEKDEKKLMKEFASWIRNSGFEYSNNNFKVSEIPIVLDSPMEFQDSHSSIRGAFHYPYNALFSRENRRFEQGLQAVIRSWQNELESELDRLDLDWRFDFARSVLTKFNHPSLKILSDSFLTRRKPLNYLWVNDNYQNLAVDMLTFEKMLKTSSRNSRLRNEKEYHDFFLNNKKILLGQDFLQTHYEQHFYYPNSRKYVEPDFLNEAHEHSLRKSEIFEVKLPNRPIRYARREKLSRYARFSINQVGRKYIPFFSEEKHAEEVCRRTGSKMLGSPFSYTLLMGRDSHREENEYLIAKELGRFAPGINLISFDELKERHLRLIERTQRFRIF